MRILFIFNPQSTLAKEALQDLRSDCHDIVESSIWNNVGVPEIDIANMRNAESFHSASRMAQSIASQALHEDRQIIFHLGKSDAFGYDETLWQVYFILLKRGAKPVAILDGANARPIWTLATDFNLSQPVTLYETVPNFPKPPNVPEAQHMPSRGILKRVRDAFLPKLTG